MGTSDVAIRLQTIGAVFLCWIWTLHGTIKNTMGSKNEEKKKTPITINLSKISTKEAKETITFSEALEKTLYGKFNYIIILIAGLMISNVFWETAAVAFYMPVSHCEFELTNFRKGLLSAVGYIGIIVTSHLWGFLADTKGRKRIMQPTLIAGFVTTVLSSFATNFWSILVLRFINGICVGGASATVYAYLGELHSDRTRSRAMMISSFIYSVGATILPFTAFAIINRNWSLPLDFMGITYKPWRLFIIVCGIQGLICGVAINFLPESPKYLLSVKREDEAKEVMQRIYRLNGGKGELELPHLVCEEDSSEATDEESNKSNTIYSFFKSMWTQTTVLFCPKYLRSTCIVCLTQFWFFFIGNGLYMWFPFIIDAVGEFMKNNPGENKYLCQIVYDKHEAMLHSGDANSTLARCQDTLEDSTFLYSFFLEVTYVISFAIITVIVNRVGNILIMFVLIVFSSSSGFVAVLLPDTFIASIFYVLLFIVGVAINLCSAATVDLYPTQLRAMALSVSLMMGRLGSVAGTNIVGGLLADYCEISFYITCCAMMSCAILILFLPRSIKSKKAIDDIET